MEICQGSSLMGSRKKIFEFLDLGLEKSFNGKPRNIFVRISLCAHEWDKFVVESIFLIGLILNQRVNKYILHA